MKKQELIHLHSLLKEVCNHYEQTETSNIEKQEYSDLNIRPTSIHKSKTEHKTAVFTLSKEITEEIDREIETQTSVVAD